MNIEEVDKWLNEVYGVSYTELCGTHNYLYEKSKKLEQENEKLNHIIDKQDRDIVALSNGNRKLKERIDKAIKLLEEYLDREYVITDEYFEGIIQELKDDYHYVYIGSDKE